MTLKQNIGQNKFFKFIFIINIYFIITGFLILPELYAKKQKKVSIDKVLQKLLENKGIEKTAIHYRKFIKKNRHDFNPDKVNWFCWGLLKKKSINNAIKILKINVEFYPENYITNGFLGYAFMFKYFEDEKIKHLNLAEKFLNNSEKFNKYWGFSDWCFNKLYLVKDYFKYIYMIPMRDGVKLYTKVFIPKDKKNKYPILLHRRPYGIPPYGDDKMSYGTFGPSNDFIKEGYIFVEQDVRGTYMSEGKFVHMRPYLPEKKSGEFDESSDAYDTIKWILKKIPIHNGKVGIWGTSYMGFYSMMALLDPHPALVAAAPAASLADGYMGDDFYHNGALHYLHAVNFFNTQGVVRKSPTKKRPQGFIQKRPKDYYKFFLDINSVANINTKFFKNKNIIWNKIMKHDNYDDFWQKRCYLPYLKNIKIPVLNIGGWLDTEDLYGTLKGYQAIEKNSPGNKNILVMGPWYHGHWSDTDKEWLGDIKFNSGSAAKFFREKVELPFFNYHLKDKGEFHFSEALIFETGTNKWRNYSKWPPEKSINKQLYLYPGFKLKFTSPSKKTQKPFTQYISNPGNPVPMQGETIKRWDNKFMHADQRFASKRKDVITFSSNNLKENVTISGAIIADLFVSTSGTDSDWIVKLIDVYPDNAPNNSPNKDTKMGGYQMLVRSNILRGKFRNSFKKPEPFIPGKVTNIKFELMDISHTFKKGHKIMVQIQSSCFPLYDRNPQQFLKINKAEAGDFKKATIRIYHSKKFPSGLKVRVIRD